jgi:hypothetical protein
MGIPSSGIAQAAKVSLHRSITDCQLKDYRKLGFEAARNLATEDTEDAEDATIDSHVLVSAWTDEGKISAM